MIFVLPFTVGVVLSVAVYKATGVWWLNSQRGIVTMMTVLFVSGLPTGWLLYRYWWRAAAWQALGAFIGSAIVLFSIGPGTIFPIVLAFVACLSAAAVFAGTALARAIR